jgi:hypothetical protein
LGLVHRCVFGTEAAYGAGMKMKLGLLVVLASSLAAACASSTDRNSSSNDALSDEATVFRDADVVQVLPDRIIYPARVAQSPRVSDLVHRSYQNNVTPVYLVGGRQKDAVNPDKTIRTDVANPNGYLRAVNSVEHAPNGDVIFHTRKASLTEAHDELVASGFATASADGCYPQTSYPFTAFNVDLNRSLYDHSFGSIGRMSIGFTDSSLTVDGNLDTEVTGHCYSPNSAHAILNLNLRGQLKLEGRFDGAFGASTGDQELYHKRIDITSVLGFPLAIDFAVTGTCDFASSGKVVADAGVTVNGGVSAGGQWASGDGISSVFNPTWPQFGMVGPSFSSNAGVNAQCTVTAKALALIFDGDEGPYAQIASYVKLDATGNGSGSTSDGAGASVHATVVGGVNASVGGSLKPFHFTLIDPISAPEYDKEWTLYDGSFSVGGQ